LEAAKAALDSAQAHLAVAEKALELAVIGPRKEDVAQGEAQLHADQAQLELLLRQLADAELVAPSDAVVRTRLLEPGEMVSPQRPVLNLAITDPKWVRAYVAETVLRLDRLHRVGCRIHAESRRNHGAAFEPRLRNSRVRRGPAGRPTPRHAG